MEIERTRFISAADLAGFGADDARPDDRRHCLELVSGAEIGRRFPVDAAGVTIGRVAPADIVLPEQSVSRAHCRLALVAGELIVTDLQSTNGCFIDGVRVGGAAPLPVGAILQIGFHFFKHELLTGTQLRKSEELDRDLATALSYVQALLPAALDDGRIRADWVYQPCAKLGGDVFGYGFLTPTLFSIYLVDVSGHGAGAAMHGVTVMNLLRQRALPGTDMTRPGEVLQTLNALFPMERHAEMYFTIWYGVYDLATRRLAFASGGHHPAYLVAPRRDPGIVAPPTPIATRNPIIGATPAGRRYRVDDIVVPPGASLYLFSDGVFEIVTAAGAEWRLDDFVALIAAPATPAETESQRLHRLVRAASRSREFDDDFSLVVLGFA